MNRTFFLKKLLPALLLSAATLLGAASQETLTLEGVLEATKAHYPYLEEEEVLRSSLDNLEKTLWYAYIPQVSVQGNIQYQSHVPSLALRMSEPAEANPNPLTEEMLTSMTDRIVMPQIPKLQYQTYIQVTQLLWSGNRVSAGAGMIRSNIAEQSARAKADFEKVEDAVTELYFSLLMLDAQLRLQDNLLLEIARQRTKAENAFRSGTATENDLDEIAVEQLRAEQQRDGLREARASLLRTIGLYTGKSYPEETAAELPPEPLTPTLVGRAGGRFAPGRMTHLLLDAELGLAEAQYKAAFADMLPSVTAFARGGYGRPGLDMFAEKGQPFFIYGLTFSWNFGNFYNLGTKRLDLENARSLVELKRRAFEINARAEAEKLTSDAAQYEEMIIKDEEIVLRRARIARRAALGEEAGTVTGPERLRQESELAAARQTLEVHRVQRLRALYMAKRTLGD